MMILRTVVWCQRLPLHIRLVGDRDGVVLGAPPQSPRRVRGQAWAVSGGSFSPSLSLIMVRRKAGIRLLPPAARLSTVCMASVSRTWTITDCTFPGSSGGLPGPRRFSVLSVLLFITVSYTIFFDLASFPFDSRRGNIVYYI